MISDLERWIDGWRALGRDIENLEAKRAALAELILLDLKPGDRALGVLVVEGRKLDRDKAKDVILPADYDAICDQVPSARKIRERLGEDVLALVQVPTRPYLKAV